MTNPTQTILAQERDRIRTALADLGGTIEMMTRERQRRALQSLFERFDFDKNGELVSLIPREWARDAFGELSVALKQISPTMPSTGVPHDAGLIYQLLAIVIVGAKSYFT